MIRFKVTVYTTSQTLFYIVLTSPILLLKLLLNLIVQQKEALDCENEKRDGFFKRFFSKDEIEKEFEVKEEEKEGFFSRLFSKKIRLQKKLK